MTGPEEPVADALEQQAEVVPTAAADDPQVADEVDEADALEQQAEVPLIDEEYDAGAGPTPA